jgi:hypothetical protein
MCKKAALCARAAECERRAKEMPDPLFREIFLDLAQQWRRLAGELDDTSEQQVRNLTAAAGKTPSQREFRNPQFRRAPD